MNRERAKSLLPIIEAFANGEDLEFRLTTSKGSWILFPRSEELTFTFPADDYEYRIKPKPREYIIELNSNGSVRHCDLMKNAPWFDDSVHIKVIEVL